jgi:type I restriction enzyme, R subunit
MPVNHREIAFEDAIENHLLESGGYEKGLSENFDRQRAIDPTVLIPFLQETQPKEWEYVYKLQKDKTEATIINDLCKALDSPQMGCLYVLRHGFKCFGKRFQVAYFAPASGLNPDIQRLYDANRLTVTRQLHFSTQDEKSLDLVFGLNGIPIVTAELKNPMTGQTWKNAIRQYQQDRNPKELIFQFKKRTLVHFAVDTDEAYMTTRLKGPGTWFLPFNLGRNSGAGNPENPNGYKTAYLWEQVWQRDSMLDLLARFLHLQVEEKTIDGKKVKRETMIFPRYHQLDVVRKLVKDAEDEGVGKNYLVQHSAGSGKSNSIAWLVHRLASLHNVNDEKVYDSVVVVTDRRILDQQLQDTIYQFEHKQGVIQRITDNQKATQLADALERGVPIIITTLQTFPFVTEKIGQLPARKYAVIVDEAHSSQGGEGAAEMKGALAKAQIREAAAEYIAENQTPDYEEQIINAMKKRGRQPNLSFFAFTATPKYKTIEVFGVQGPEGKPVAYHVYSMRQAIEEGFVLDVLKHYTTYETYFGLIKSVEDDPKVDKRNAAKELARFMNLHPHNIAQKVEVIVEHFRNFVRHKIGGKAKAMIVTGSRVSAVRYKQTMDKYIDEKGYLDIGVLVAFSGEVQDPDVKGKSYTEVQMNNGVRETELPQQFNSDAYHVLVVAEKYQTGFDQPLLHTMYVDKKLAGIHAVQTLSRLNRICPPSKEDTFVLDFYNTMDDIKDAFQPYYEETMVGEQVDYHQLYELQARLEGYQVYGQAEVEEFCKIFYRPKQYQTSTDHAKMNACIDPAVRRFTELDDEKQEEFRKVLVGYINLYGFLSQIIPFQDSDLEKHYSYARFLLSKLPKRQGGPLYNFDEEVALKYYRLQKISEGSIVLQSGTDDKIDGPTEVGTGTVRPGEIDLSQLIDLLNERFGTSFTPADQLFFDSIREDALRDESLRQAAKANTMENFGFVFLKALEDLFINRMDMNEEITAKFMNEEEFKKAVGQNLLKEVYEEINKDAA